MRITAVLLFLSLSLVSPMTVAGQKSQWTGWLTDAKCAANGAKEVHKGCALRCVEGGQPIVFVAEDKKVYKLESADKVKSLVGERVVLSGTLDGETIAVLSAKKAE